MGDIIIRHIQMPSCTKAFTATDENDDYNIYVNTIYNSIVQQEAIDHELRHIDRCHFHRDTDVTIDENEAENM